MVTIATKTNHRYVDLLLLTGAMIIKQVMQMLNDQVSECKIFYFGIFLLLSVSNGRFS